MERKDKEEEGEEEEALATTAPSTARPGAERRRPAHRLSVADATEVRPRETSTEMRRLST